MKSFAALTLAFLAISGSRLAVSLKAPFYEPNTRSDRSGIVHLFEWKWGDIAKECEDFLAPNGFAAIQISPPTENLIVKGELGDRPWYERYQPISYNLITRSGNEHELAEMIRRCNKVGVRIYADIVINHMTQNFDNILGTGGSKGNAYDMFYPAVPYETGNFHKPQCAINNYNDAVNVRNCELEGLHDLDHAQPYVREKIVNMMNHLIDLGVAGFRVDAVKHMWPQEVLMIMEGAKALNTSFGFAPGTAPFVYQEVIDHGGEAISHKEYTHIGRLLDFKYSREISRVFSGGDLLKYLRNWGTDWGFIWGPISVVFVDNHDNQRDNNGFGSTLTYKRSKQYKMAVAFMLAHPHSIPRVMSSFKFDHPRQGPPMTPEGELISPKFDDQGACVNGWVCEHRWRQIKNMIGFRVAANVTDIENWWDNGANKIAFSRGNRAFIAFNNDDNPLSNDLQTGLPEGVYCDVISGDVVPSKNICSGKTITVNANGMAHIDVHHTDGDGFLAIHVNNIAGVGGFKNKQTREVPPQKKHPVHSD